jgi:hypothetical protein
VNYISRQCFRICILKTKKILSKESWSRAGFRRKRENKTTTTDPTTITTTTTTAAAAAATNDNNDDNNNNNNHSLTHGAEPFLRCCQLCSYSRTSQRFMGPKGSLPCTQDLIGLD